MELIEKEKAIAAIKRLVQLPDSARVQAMGAVSLVKAVEVVHGEWILCIDGFDCEFIECPLCGEQFYDGDNDTFDRPWNYCPNCGARMDGERKVEDG